MFGLLGDMNFDDPRTQAMMAMGLQMMQASGPSRFKRTFGDIVGEGGMAGMDAYRKQKLLLEKQKEMEQERQLRQIQIDAILKKQADATKRDELLRSVVSPMSQGEAMSLHGGPTIAAANAVGQQKPIDVQRLIVGGIDPAVAKALAEAKDYGRPEVARTVDIEGPNGERLVQQKDKFGRNVGEPVPAYMVPQLVDQGDRRSFVKPTTGASFPVNISPYQRQQLGLDYARLGNERQRIELDRARLATEGGNGKAPAGFRWKADGSGDLEPIPGGPADQKNAKKNEGAVRLTKVLGDVLNGYKELAGEGGVVDYRRSAIANMANRAASSGAGQVVGQMFGTKAQQIRDKINQARPLLINYIRQSSDMGARGMDSEKELEFYLAAATDPTKDLKSNLEAIKRLDEAYGTGQVSAMIDKMISETYGGQNRAGETWLPSVDAIDAELNRRGGK